MYDRVGGSRLKRLATVARSLVRDPGQLLTGGAGGYCTVCDARRTFLTSGTPPRRRVLCGRCLSLERHRLLWLVVDRVMKERSGPTCVLHFAPEAFMARLLESAHRYVGIDIEPGVDGVVGNAESLPFRDESFDVVISSHVLEHVPDDSAALTEIARVLAPGGEAILAVPVAWGYELTYENPSLADGPARAIHFGQADHVRFYGADFPDRVAATGLDVERVVLDPAREIELGLGRGESVFRARKPA